MLTATAAFMDSLEKWLRAARENDFATARGHAEHLVKSGEMLSVHPDLMRCFAARFPGVEPKTALVYFCQLLVCATDGRARVLNDWVQGNKPTDRLNEPYS